VDGAIECQQCKVVVETCLTEAINILVLWANCSRLRQDSLKNLLPVFHRLTCSSILLSFIRNTVRRSQKTLNKAFRLANAGPSTAPAVLAPVFPREGLDRSNPQNVCRVPPPADTDHQAFLNSPERSIPQAGSNHSVDPLLAERIAQ
jgi:hypothetical protein